MKTDLNPKRLSCALCLAAVFFSSDAQAAGVFPIAANPGVVEVGGWLAFDGTNYLVGLVSGTDVGAQLVSSSGTLIGSLIKVGKNAGFPPAAAFAFGRSSYLAVWSDNSISSGVDMFGQLIAPSGAKVGSAFPLLPSRGSYGFQSVQAVAFDGTNFLVVWRDKSNRFYYGQLVTAGGTLSGSAFLISSQQQNADSLAAAVAFGVTNYLVAWQSSNGSQGDNYKTYGAFVSQGGSASSPFQISQTISRSYNPLAVAFDGTNYLVVWNKDIGLGFPSPTVWDLYGRLVSATGTFPGNELALVTDPGDQILPSLAFDGSNYLLAWSDYTSTLFLSNSTIHGQFFSPSASPAGSEFTVFLPQGANRALFALNGVLFDGAKFALSASMGNLTYNANGDVNGITSGDVYGAFLAKSTVSASPPAITVQPQSQAVSVGASVTFSVVASGTAPLSYQWQFNGFNLRGATGSSLTVNSAQTSNAGNYTVVVSNSAGSVTSQPAALTLSAGVAFSVSPSSITSDYAGNVTLNITGLTSGQTVRVERYYDLNGNGVIDAGQDFLIQSFTVTDGQVPAIGGVRNLNVPGDDDGAVNGQMQVMLPFSGNLGVAGGGDGAVGSFVFKVSDPLSSFTPMMQPFAVAQKVLPQGVRGQITSAANGQPLAGAFAILIPKSAAGAVMVPADASGNFSVFAPPGNYSLIVVKPGFVANLSQASVTVAANQFATTNPAIMPSALTISGKLTDASNGAGIAGQTVIALSTSGWGSFGFTDTNGNYSLAAVAGSWKVYPPGTDLAHVGYMGLKSGVTVNIATASAINVNLAVPKVTALIYGAITNPGGNPINGVSFTTGDSPNLYNADGTSMAPGGNFTLGVLAGTWNVGADKGPLAAQGYSGITPNGANVSVSAGQAVQVNFVAQPLPGTLPPSIVAQPQSQTVTAGASVTFSVVASGTAPLIYQWRLNGNNITSATSSSLTVNNAQAANAGNYTVLVSNAGGSVTSASAVLTVNQPAVAPTIGFTRLPKSLVLSWPTNFTLQATAALSASNNWSIVRASPTVSNGQNTLTIDISKGNQFFRVIKP